jgi:GNAT superfamily N-acetyltransferase
MMDDHAETQLEDIIAWLKNNAARDFALQLAAGASTAGLQTRARSEGFAPAGNGWSKLFKNIAFQGDGDAPKIDALTIITDPEPKLYGQLVVDSMILPSLTADWFSALLGRPHWHIFVAVVGERAVGSGAMYVEDKWAWFGIDGTLEGSRRMGIQAALIQVRSQMARKLGALYLTAETGRPEKATGSHTSRNNYRRNGFTEAYHRLNFKLG